MPVRSDRIRRSSVLAATASLALLLAGAALAAGAETAAPIPNIVMVIGDDHGWPYFGFMGDEIVKTPRLDGLAREGVVFPYGYTSASTCKPSLRSLLTGLYPLQWRARLEALKAEGLERSETDLIRNFDTLPRLLQQRDFASFQGGKYWEGSFAGGGFTHGMKQMQPTQPAGAHARLQARAGGVGLELGRTSMEPLFEFLDAHADRPFFVWFAPKLPHTPHDPPEDLLALYADAVLSDPARRYYANITRFDRVLGQLLDKLDALGLREKTLVVYLSDNGWEQGPHETPAVKQLGGPKGKSSMYELGFRTPIVVRWPGRIAAGGRHAALLSDVDVFTTLLDIVGVEQPPDRMGVSFAPLLFGASTTPPREVVIGGMKQLRPPAAVEAARAASNGHLVRSERAFFVRNSEWHYIWYARHERYPDRSPDALFRIDSDPFETNDVAAANPGLIAAFCEQIHLWRRDATTRTRNAVAAEAKLREPKEAQLREQTDAKLREPKEAKLREQSDATGSGAEIPVGPEPEPGPSP